MRGEFIRGDGLVIPNNVSIAGASAVLDAAFRSQAQAFYAALITGVPSLDMTMGDMVEPTIATNGYDRIAITQDALGWPTLDDNGQEAFVESDWLEWIAVGGAFDKPVQRIALVGTAVYNGVDPVFALSGLMPNEITIDPDTVQALRRFKYRFYL